MKPELVKAASEVIHNQQILVNMVSRRVRQLTIGHRPLVEFVPGMGHADVPFTATAHRTSTPPPPLRHNPPPPPPPAPPPGPTPRTTTPHPPPNASASARHLPQP